MVEQVSPAQSSSTTSMDRDLITGRAAVITAPGRVRLDSCEPLMPGPQQVRVRLEGCGVCASNIPVWEGRPWFDYPQSPGSPGHEGWGIVDQVGEEVSHLQPGDRVALLSYKAYADFDIAEASEMVKLPPELADAPFPAEPLACAVNVFRRSAIEPGQTVAILGIGFLGALLTQMAHNAGARVIAISRREFALDIARQCGADDSLPWSASEDVAQQIGQLTNGKGCERIIEATGKQEALDLATQMIAVRGRLVIAGYHQDGMRQVNMQLWNWRGIDVINAHERDPAIYVEGMQLAVQEVLAGRIRVEPLITHRFPLEQLPEALEHTRRRPDGFLKAVVVC